MGFMTFTASRLLITTLHRKMAEANIDLTSEQWGLLSQFWSKDDLTQEELIQAACTEKSSVSRAVMAMERKGLITRRLDPNDARRKILCLTDKANAVKESSIKAVLATLAQALKNIDPQEQATCLKVLALIKNNLRDGGKL